MFLPLLFVLFEMANCTCIVVSRISSVRRFLIVRPMCLLILFALYGMTFVNCLLNALALSLVLVVSVPKKMFLFYCIGSFLLDSFASFC